MTVPLSRVQLQLKKSARILRGRKIISRVKCQRDLFGVPRELISDDAYASLDKIQKILTQRKICPLQKFA